MKKFMKKAALTIALASALGAATATAVSLVQNAVTDPVTAETALDVTAAVLKNGSKGSEVKEVQRKLKQWGFIHNQCQ